MVLLNAGNSTMLDNFRNFAEARAAVARWIDWYNRQRPHQALGYLSPHQFRAQQLQRVA